MYNVATVLSFKNTEFLFQAKYNKETRKHNLKIVFLNEVFPAWKDINRRMVINTDVDFLETDLDEYKKEVFKIMDEYFEDNLSNVVMSGMLFPVINMQDDEDVIKSILEKNKVIAEDSIWTKLDIVRPEKYHVRGFPFYRTPIPNAKNEMGAFVYCPQKHLSAFCYQDARYTAKNELGLISDISDEAVKVISSNASTVAKVFSLLNVEEDDNKFKEIINAIIDPENSSFHPDVCADIAKHFQEARDKGVKFSLDEIFEFTSNCILRSIFLSRETDYEKYFLNEFTDFCNYIVA